MNLELYLRKTLSRKKIALMTHAVIGYPTLQETELVVKEMAEAGADIIELQIPFSDPVADGPVIMEANDHALKNGVTVEDAFKLMKKMSSEVTVPLLFMGYYQTLFAYGLEAFCQKAQEVGTVGLIIPDMPLDEEESEHFMQLCEKYELAHIRLLSPTSTDQRIIANARHQNGFVYCTSRAGTTGATNQLHPELHAFLKRVKAQVTVPIAVGFGISLPEHVESLQGQAEVAVIGSAIITLIKNKGVSAVKPFLQKITKKTYR